MTELNRYGKIIEHIFFSRYSEGVRVVEFEREDIEKTAQELGIKLPKNLGDLIYSFRYRTQLPASISSLLPAGET
jgi:hypothetical protein